jgi:stage II sporulation protein M
MVKKRSESYFSKLNNYFYGNFKLSLKFLGEIRNYILFSLLLFFIFGIIGFAFPIFFKEEIIKMIAELVKETEGLGVIGLTRFIIMNNTQGAFFAMILGIFFGIIPLIILIMNGYVLGFVSNQVAAQFGGLVLWRLLPHGIFEIPAIVIAGGLGIKLGLFLFISKEKTWKEFKKSLANSLRAFILIVIPLLVIAGIIEGLLINFL